MEDNIYADAQESIGCVIWYVIIITSPAWVSVILSWIN